MVDIEDGEASFHISYEKGCNITGDLKRGEGTIALGKATLSFTFSMFPSLQHIYLKDWSRVECKGIDIYLPPIQLVEYGETWYQRHFKAKPEHSEVQKKMQRYLNIIQKKPDFKVLWKSIQLYISSNDNSFKNKFEDLYAQHSTLRDFIIYLKRSNQCEYYADWLETYFTNTSKVMLDAVEFLVYRKDSDYKITVREVEENPYANQVRSRVGLDILSSFTPSSQYGGTNLIKGRRGKTFQW